MLEVVYAPDGKLSRFAASFVQYCEVSMPPLFGEIRFNSTIPFAYSNPNSDASPDPIAIVIPSPVDPGVYVTSLATTAYGINTPTAISITDGEYSVNGGLFTSANGIVNNKDRIVVRAVTSNTPGGIISPTLTIGDYTASTNVTTYIPGTSLSGVRMRSTPGDYIGGGIQQLYLAPADTITVGSQWNGAYISIDGRNGDWWWVSLSGPGGSALAPGVYENARRAPFANGNPGLDMSGNGRGCNTLTGRFTVYEVSYDSDGKVDKLAADFEQHCEGGPSALFGEVRINSGIPFSSLSRDVLFGVTVQKVGNGVGTIYGTGGEFSCGSACLIYLPLGYSLGLAASPAGGSAFRGWENSSQCSGTGGCIHTVGNYGAIVARFEIPTKLTILRTGDGQGTVYSYPAGISCPANCERDFDINTLVTLQASASYGSVFAGWSGGGCSGKSSCTLSMSDATTVTANFVSGFELSVVRSQQGGSGQVTSVPAGIDCGATCSTVLSNGTQITLSAIADPGSRFVGWTNGACSGTGNCSLTVNGTTQVTALFQSGNLTINVSKAGTGTGTITSTNGVINCGATCSGIFNPSFGISLVATPSPGMVFVGWSHTCSSASTCNISASNNVAVTATFTDPAAPTAPGAPALMQAVAGDGSAMLVFAVPANNGGSPITGYVATCQPGNTSATVISSPVMVGGLTNGLPYQCSVIARNIIGTGTASDAMAVTPAAMSPMTLVAVQSRKTHGPAGIFDMQIDTSQPLSGAVTVESRTMGAGHLAVFQFNRTVISIGTATIRDAAGNSIGSASSTIENSNVIVTLTGIPDNTRATITLTGVNGTLDVSAPIGFLIGDANNSRSVNASDISGIKARAGQSVDSSNFRFDVNASGGINATDISAAKARSGLSIP